MEQDVTSLPDVALVKILSYLSLDVRFNVSLTCRRLNAMFYHPSLWTRLVLTIPGGHYSSNISECHHNNSKYISIIPDIYFQIIEKFGQHIQHLKFVTIGFFMGFPSEWPSLMNEISLKCQLHSLTLRANKLVLNRFRPTEYALSVAHYLKPIVNLVHSSQQLKYFSLLSWPQAIHGNDPELDILTALIANRTAKDVWHLDLYWMDKDDGWVEKCAYFPSAKETIKIVTHFEHLTILSLRVQNLSNELLHQLTLSKRTKIEKLNILVIYSSHDPKYKFPEISECSWKELSTKCCNLQVSIVIVNRIKNHELSVVLVNHIPVVSIVFLEYAQVDEDILVSIQAQYSTSLKHLESRCESSMCDNALLQLVKACENMTMLVYLGKVDHITVLNIAKIHGTKWKRLEFNRQLIEIRGHCDLVEAADPDLIVGTLDTGAFYLVNNWDVHTDSANLVVALNDLNRAVTNILGYKWSV